MKVNTLGGFLVLIKKKNDLGCVTYCRLGLFRNALIERVFQGKMFPTLGDVHLAPFTDEQLYMEQFTKANFW